MSNGLSVLFGDLNASNLTIIAMISPEAKLINISIMYNVSVQIVHFDIYLAHLCRENNRSIPKLDDRIEVNYNNSYAYSEPNESISTPFGLYINITTEDSKNYSGYIGWWIFKLHLTLNTVLTEYIIVENNNNKLLIVLILSILAFAVFLLIISYYVRTIQR